MPPKAAQKEGKKKKVEKKDLTAPESGYKDIPIGYKSEDSNDDDDNIKAVRQRSSRQKKKVQPYRDEDYVSPGKDQKRTKHGYVEWHNFV